MKSAIRTEINAIWQLAWPVLIGQLATVAMGVVDVAMTGHLSANDLAAVAMGTALWIIAIVTMMGVMMSVNALVAHEVGANRMDKIGHLVRQALWLAALVGVVASLLLAASARVFAHLDLDAQVRDKATTFVYIISFGLPAFVMYRALYGYTTSLNQTKPVMLIAIGGLIFNIVVNWFLIFGRAGLPALGAIGCAVATASGIWMMLFALIWWIRHAEHYRISAPFTHWESPEWKTMIHMLKLGLPIGVTYFAEVSAFSIVGLLVARFGVVTIAAHQITLNFSSFVFMVPMSFAVALTTCVGQALGEGNAQRARLISWVGMGMSISFAAISALFIAVFRNGIAGLYTSDLEVQQLAGAYLLFAAFFQLSDATQVSASGAIRGYKVTRTPMAIHLLAFWGISLPLGYILGLSPTWAAWKPAQAMGGAGFWTALVVGLTVAAVLLALLLHTVSSARIKRQ